MNLQPRNDYILVQRIEDAPRGTIIVPDVAKEKSIKGKVLAVGPGKYIEGVNGNQVRRPLEVKVGDTVFFNSRWNDFGADHYTTDLQTEARYRIERERLHLVQEADVFLVVK